MAELELPAEFQSTVEIIARTVSKKYIFGIYDNDDIVQEVYVLCLEAIKNPKFDKTKNLYNFLFTHVNHRLKNLKRNKYFRSECPCKLCSFKEDGDTGHLNKKHCETYLRWLKNNTVKKNLASPSYIDNKLDILDKKKNHEEQVDLKDFLDRIDTDMPMDLRESYLKLKSGISITYREKEVLLAFLERYRDGY